jgi:peptide/nickel transport system substrate-binding protein
MDESLAVRDVIAGTADVYWQAVAPAILQTLSDADRAKLDFYTVPSGSWSLMVNPIPNKAPYTHTLNNGTVEFNPFAIREVRFALNFLIDRKKLVDEILFGAGEATYTAMTPGQPGTYRYNLLASKFGFTPTGNERKAIADIDAAMTAASNLSENRGKLVKRGQFWQYNGRDVSIKFMIRVDDPTGRLPAGRYIADQIEKAGIKVERLEYDRSRASTLAYYSDPADYEWHLYTEGWGAGATRAWWDVSLSQMYAPFYGYMAGGAEEENWNYTNDRIDELAKKGFFGQYMTEDDYWKGNIEGLELGLQDACRIFLATQFDNFIANKDRFNSRMAYGMGDGPNHWSVRTADVKSDADGQFKGQKVLRIVQYSARGSLFMNAWDPVGTEGFNDVYASAIMAAACDPATFEAPNNAADTPFSSTYDPASLRTAPQIQEDGSMGGTIQVPATAVLWSPETNTWKAVGSGVTAAASGTGSIVPAKWQHGEDISIVDVRYAMAFAKKWATKLSENDKFYDSAFASFYEEDLKTQKGFVFNNDGSVTSYIDYFFAPDPTRTLATVAAVGYKAGNPGRESVVSWEIYEALGLMVAEGAASRTVYSFNESDVTTEVDVIAPSCVADIKAKLQEMASKNHVPASIRDFITAADAVKRYNAAIAFIDKYGHALIGNGPFIISEVNTTANSITLDANRNYYQKSDYWPNYFKQEITRIENVRAPANPSTSRDAVFEISVSSFIYPEADTTPLTNRGKVELRLQLPNGSEKVFNAQFTRNGLFTGTIPASDMANLTAGQSYTVVIISYLADEAPSVAVTDLVLF